MNATKMRDEQAKIAALYRQQSAEYMQRAREALISALQLVNDDDQTIGANQDASKKGADNSKKLHLSSDRSLFDEE